MASGSESGSESDENPYEQLASVARTRRSTLVAERQEVVQMYVGQDADNLGFGGDDLLLRDVVHSAANHPHRNRFDVDHLGLLRRDCVEPILYVLRELVLGCQSRSIELDPEDGPLLLGAAMDVGLDVPEIQVLCCRVLSMICKQNTTKPDTASPINCVLLVAKLSVARTIRLSAHNQYVLDACAEMLHALFVDVEPGLRAHARQWLECCDILSLMEVGQCSAFGELHQQLSRHNTDNDLTESFSQNRSKPTDGDELAPTFFHEAMTLFDQLDVDSSDTLTVAELSGRLSDLGLTEHEVGRVVTLLDSDHNQLITRQEFIAGFSASKIIIAASLSPNFIQGYMESPKWQTAPEDCPEEVAAFLSTSQEIPAEMLQNQMTRSRSRLNLSTTDMLGAMSSDVGDLRSTI